MRFLRDLTSLTALATVIFCTYPVFADGDPMEALNLQAATTTVSPLNATDLKPDEQIAESEEAVATITADGDFLLPTYLLPGETATVTRKTTVEKTYDQIIPAAPVAQVAQAPFVPAVPAVPVAPVAAPKPAAPTTPTPSPTVADTPDLSDIDALLQETAPTVATPAHKERILIPLAPVVEAKAPDVIAPPVKKALIQSDYADQLLDNLENGSETAFKMPHEMRITFYPRAKAFSGQTLKWIKAFALTALQDPRLVVEVRASCAEADLQTDRLKLVQAALKEAGLSSHQVIINFTDRPVDTMLLLATPRQDKSLIVDAPKSQKMPKNKAQITKW